MKPSIAAALLSGLVLPGLGQLAVLKRPRRGLAFMLPALAAVCWMLAGLWRSTTVLLDEALRGTLPPDPVLIASRLAEQGDSPGASMAALVLLVCWIGSVADALLVRERA